MTRLADLIFQRLKSEVSDVFYLPGGGCAFLVDALAQSGLNAVCHLHEQAAGYAAVAYGQLRGLGVVLVTSGPGATNVITPCAGAWVDGAPLLVISGAPNSWTMIGETGLRSRGIQEVEIIPAVQHWTKYARTVTVDNALYCLEEAIHAAKEGRPGSVWLEVPLNVQGMEV